MNIYSLLLVGTGGFIGSVARYLFAFAFSKRINTQFPYATLCINILGSFILGMLVGLLIKRGESADNWRLFIGTGVCGGFTTFSTFAIENVSLLQQKMYGASFLYMLISLIIGIIAALLGVFIGRNL